MELTKDAHERIFSAADALYEQAGRAGFPTVDAVRKTARVNMNDASAGMKEWRRAQTAQAIPVAVHIPEAVQQAGNAALSALWQAAQELSNECLRAAQAGWDAERIEADTLNKQMADAYEAQAAELNAAQERLEEFGKMAEKRELAIRQQLNTTNDALLNEQKRTAFAEQRVEQIEHRAADLRIERGRALNDISRLRAELDGLCREHITEIRKLQTELKVAAEKTATATDTMRTELLTIKSKADATEDYYQEQRRQAVQARTQRDEARKEAAMAREDAAALRGQLDAIKEQNAQWLQTLNGQDEHQPPKTEMANLSNDSGKLAIDGE